ncbi:hypothetical protein JL100_011515 [Skermanella mucosa]|uniref:hypothetical protein n=1 Tax=Skermanella mucosa TaxID=1789672 RepID=UPI00192C6F75|nr:hypothetical protein [Skermanella mucosa]UEM23324.1 hypothetical protein JL100_011515 [Skermanella mucosa]
MQQVEGGISILGDEQGVSCAFKQPAKAAQPEPAILREKDPKPPFRRTDRPAKAGAGQEDRLGWQQQQPHSDPDDQERRLGQNTGESRDHGKPGDASGRSQDQAGAAVTQAAGERDAKITEHPDLHGRAAQA